MSSFHFSLLKMEVKENTNYNNIVAHSNPFSSSWDEIAYIRTFDISTIKTIKSLEYDTISPNDQINVHLSYIPLFHTFISIQRYSNFCPKVLLCFSTQGLFRFTIRYIKPTTKL